MTVIPQKLLAALGEITDWIEVFPLNSNTIDNDLPPVIVLRYEDYDLSLTFKEGGLSVTSITPPKPPAPVYRGNPGDFNETTWKS